MGITIAKLKELGGQAERGNDLSTTFKIYWRLVDASPQDIENRLKIADLLVKAKSQDAATEVYKAVALYGIRSGHPLIALVVMKVMEERGVDITPLFQELARNYASTSDKLSKRGQRLSPEHPDTEVDPPDLEAEIESAALIAGAARAAANLDNVSVYPQNLHPIPLLSQLPPETFIRLCAAMRAIRVPDG